MISEVRRRIEDPPVEITISLLTGYAAYLTAEEIGVSGVLATVAAGLYVGWRGPLIASASTRVSGFAVWEFGVYLVNAVLFVLIGFQLRGIVEDLSDLSMSTILASSIAVVATVVGARFAWMFTMPYLVRIARSSTQPGRTKGGCADAGHRSLGRHARRRDAGCRALPPPDDRRGDPFPQRALLIFLAYVVVLFTIVVPGLTLPALIRDLGIRDDGAEEREELAARISAAEAALERLRRARRGELGSAGEDRPAPQHLRVPTEPLRGARGRGPGRRIRESLRGVRSARARADRGAAICHRSAP